MKFQSFSMVNSGNVHVIEKIQASAKSIGTKIGLVTEDNTRVTAAGTEGDVITLDDNVSYTGTAVPHMVYIQLDEKYFGKEQFCDFIFEAVRPLTIPSDNVAVTAPGTIPPQVWKSKKKSCIERGQAINIDALTCILTPAPGNDKKVYIEVTLYKEDHSAVVSWYELQLVADRPNFGAWNIDLQKTVATSMKVYCEEHVSISDISFHGKTVEMI